MREDLGGHTPQRSWSREISPDWDKWQSEWLVMIMSLVIASFLGLQIFDVVGTGHLPGWLLGSIIASGAFALLVWRMRASTPGGAAIGGMICLRLLVRMRYGESWTRTAVPELIALFLLTYAATRFAKGRVGTEDRERRGRQASQVVANLGITAMFAGSVETGFFVAGVAALAEAVADTVSSEMGQALGGSARSITTGRPVPAGTDGGVSVVGSLCGMLAAAAVAATAVAVGGVGAVAGAVIFVAGCAGVVFDSLLGATLERCGWLGNDLVNFSSTAFAAFVALQGMRFLVAPQPYW